MSQTTSGFNFPIGIDREERLQQAIEDKYGVGFFKTFIGRTGEATREEILQIKSEQAQLIGSQIDSLENEALKTAFFIQSEIEDAAGRLPPTPDILLDTDFLESLGIKNLEIKVEFTGPLSIEQKKLFVLTPIRSALTEIAPIAELKPESLDRINFPQLTENILKATNFPQDALFSDEEVEEIQAKRRAEQQAQMAMQAAEVAGKALPAATGAVDPSSIAAQLSGA